MAENLGWAGLWRVTVWGCAALTIQSAWIGSDPV
jgi:hypothetical protein